MLFKYGNLAFCQKFGSDEERYDVICKIEDRELYQQYKAKDKVYLLGF